MFKRSLLAAALLVSSLAAFAQKTYVAYIGSYAAGTTYAKNEIVLSGSTYYISLAPINIGHTPSSSPSQWAVFSNQTGFAGPTGESAYQIAVDNGYNGTLQQWLASLVGAAGANGTNGTNGANGSNGTNGTNGTNGATWYQGSSAPSSGTGANGDFYLNSTTGDVSQKSSGSWSVVANLKGPAGAGSSVQTFSIPPTFGGASTALSAGTYSTLVYNDTGQTEGILAAFGYADSGSSTVTITDLSTTATIMPSCTAAPSRTSCTLTQATLPAGDALLFTVTADGTSKTIQPTIRVCYPYGQTGCSPTITASAPAFSPGSQTSTSPISVALTCAVGTASYTVDGSTPTTSSTAYSSAIALSTPGATTIKALCGGVGITTSSVVSQTYTYTPIASTPSASPTVGTYSTAQSVTLSSSTSGASIYYTTDGSTPTTSSTLYTSAVSVSATTTIKAIAHKSSYTDSSVGSFAYTIGVDACATLPALNLRLEASSLSGANPTTWPDLSGNSDTVTLNGSPVFGTAIPTPLGGPSLVFDGNASKYGSLASEIGGGNYNGATTKVAIFVVAKLTSGTSSFTGATNNPGSPNYFVGGTQGLNSDAAAGIGSGGSTIDNNWHFLGVVYDSTTSSGTFYKDGTTDGTFTSTGTFSQNINSVFRGLTGGESTNAAVAALYIKSAGTLPNSAQISALHACAAQRYGVN